MLVTPYKTQRGFMAIVLVVFLVVFTVIAASIVSMSTSGSLNAGDHVNASRALFMAESGVEWAALELFDSDDPETACNDLENDPALPVSVNGQGSFDIANSSYAGDGGCSLTVRGMHQQTVRVLSGKIPESVLEGNTGGGDDLFDDGSAWQGGNNDVEDGVLYIRKQGGDEAHANGGNVLSDTWEAGDTIYFAANISPSPAGLDVRVRFPGGPGGYATCAWNESCANVAPSHPLHEHYNTVWVLSNSVSGDSADVNDVRIRVDFSHQDPGVTELAIADGCIGTEEHCAGAAGDDPIDDGTWDENP